MNEKLRKTLFAHLHPTEYASIFPRDCAIPYAYGDAGEPLLTRLQLTNELSYYFLFGRIKKDYFVAVYSNEQIEKRMVDTIFIDIDDRDINKSYEKLWGILTRLERMGIDVGKLRIYFSGKKGFHIFLDFDPIWLPNFVSFRSVCMRLLRELKIEKLIDIRTVGDWRRVSRVPYTKHSGSGLYCYPVDPTESIQVIKSEAVNPSIVEIKVNRRNCRSIRKYLKGIVKSYGRVYKRNIECRISRRPKPEGLELPPCIKAWLSELAETHELDHYARLNIAIFLLRSGWSVDEIVNLFSIANDFDEHKTRYQVEYAKKRELLMWSCHKLIDMGLCPLENPKSCTFYPSINRYYGWKKSDLESSDGSL